MSSGLIRRISPGRFPRWRRKPKEKGYPVELKAALIGSCTNSSYEDISRSAHIARQGLKAGLKAKTPFLVSPGSERIYHTMKRDGFLETFEKFGGTVLSNSCGPCIGQWKRADGVKGKADSIVSSFNRNFPGRNDGINETLSFLASPEIVTAYAISGNLALILSIRRSRARMARNSSLSRRRVKSFPPRDLQRARKVLLRRRPAARA